MRFLPPRRWFQFRLTTWFAIVVVLSCVMLERPWEWISPPITAMPTEDTVGPYGYVHHAALPHDASVGELRIEDLARGLTLVDKNVSQDVRNCVKWQFAGFFVVDGCGNALPKDITDQLLGEGGTATRICGQWRLESASNKIRLYEIGAIDQPDEPHATMLRYRNYPDGSQLDLGDRTYQIERP